MKIGVVGFAGSGKTTLFNALTGQEVPTGFGGKVNLGTIKVPDHRVDALAEIWNPKKVTYTEILFADVPGGRGESSLEPATVAKIREMDALAHVIRGFDNGAAPDPVAELENFASEMLLADMAVLEKRLQRLRKDRSDKNLLSLLERCFAHLESERPLRTLDLSEADKKALSGFAPLTLKPILYVVSLPEGETALPADMAAYAQERDIEVLPLCTTIEAEIAALPQEEQAAFLEDLGVSEPASTRFVHSAYRLLNLITFLTQGEDECRAWSLRKGSNAQEAAGTIHSDLARGFIRAEVIAFDDFVRYKSEAACREQGVLRVEGKDYVVQDGDILHIRFNV